MFWQYMLVFVGAFLFDVVPFPFFPAFTIMTYLQVTFQLNIWWVIIVGVVGSIAGRYTLTLYIPLIADKYLKLSKNQDIQFLGDKMKSHKWKGQLFVLAYSLLPLPTTPLFLAAGMGRIRAIYIIPAFFIGKFTSDTLALHLGKYVSDNFNALVADLSSWKSIASLVLFLLLMGALLFIDWRTLIQQKKLLLKFRILK